MLKDITLGQYYPIDSAVHRLDPRTKLLLTFIFIAMLFVVRSSWGYLAAVLLVVTLYIVAKIPFRMLVKSIKPIIPILLFTAIVNMFFVQGDILFSLGFLKITSQGLFTAWTMAVRLICLIAGTALLMFTTMPIALTDGIENLLSPLKRFHFPAHELAMMMTIALRFIPTLIEETDKIMSAQKARGADMDSGGLIKRAKALIPIFIPLFISAFRRAYDLALAMECRCYRGGQGKTRMNKLAYKWADLFALLFTLLAFGVIILINII